jgi:hypothetical protein
VVKAVYLKSRGLFTKISLELPFPESDPLLDLHCFVQRRTKEMHVIGHDHVGADHPSVSRLPHVQQRIVNSSIRKILLAMQRTDCHENDRCLTAKNENALGWVTPLFERRGDIPRLD